MTTVKLIEPQRERCIGSGNESKPPTKLAARLRNLRVNRGLTQAQCADLVARGYAGRVSDYETGAHIPTLRTLQLYAAAFGTTVSRILDGVL